MSTLLQTFAGLALILGLFVAAAWLARRLNGGRTLLGGGGPMRVVGALALGPRERIVLVEVAETWLVIGLAPGQMRTLHTLPKGELPPAATAGDHQFAHWLRQFRDASRTGKD
ncbi:MAG TPA: flagellar biosynthetic protein FliO [Azospira sp.]|nr:flagellar biosynthetic protein FliO [Azospira sp.]